MNTAVKYSVYVIYCSIKKEQKLEEKCRIKRFDLKLVSAVFPSNINKALAENLGSILSPRTPLPTLKLDRLTLN